MKRFNKKKLLISISCIITILLCTLPMNLSPIWNGEIPQYRNQYEIMADSFLKGHLYLDYDYIDENFVNMENPYDPDKREELGVDYYWDHAFYKGKYYMYFGVAPVFLTFIPYKIITGKTLVTYHATQLYVAIFIIGVFVLFDLINKHFFQNKKTGLYILSSVAFSMLSVWISTSAPAMYCTAISAGICLSIWSIILFFKAFYEEYSINKRLIYALFGSLCGALIFACRPPIGISNIILIPMLLHYLKKEKYEFKRIKKMALFIIPYIVVAILLMMYNYARFDNPFEFGQSYQLTSVDQHNYKNILKSNSFTKIKYESITFFTRYNKPTSKFPFVKLSGVFFNFPILIFPYIILLSKKFRKKLKEKNLGILYIFFLISPLMVGLTDIIFSPYVLERYKMDVYYLIATSCFIAILTSYDTLSIKLKKVFEITIYICLVLTIVKTILLFMVPYDCNVTDFYPEINKTINNFLKR